MILVPPRTDYSLKDAGNGRKLERFGSILVNRPEVGAPPHIQLPLSEWHRAHGEFQETGRTSGIWKNKKNLPDTWILDVQDEYFSCSLECFTSTFKHVGVFPEQIANWQWLSVAVKKMKGQLNETPRILNLFAYTGAASIICALQGAAVTHVDSARSTINRAKKNAELNDLSSLRWIADDALTFVEREQKRGNTYHGIIMDPPAYGVGARKKRWKLEDHLPTLVHASHQILCKDSFLFLLNTYSPLVSTSFIEESLRASFSKTTQDILIDDIGLRSETDQSLVLGKVARVVSSGLPLSP